MKFFILSGTFIFLASILYPVKIFAQDKPFDAVKNFFEGFSNADEEIILKSITADFLLLEDAEIWNRDSVVKVIREIKGKGIQRINHFEIIKETVNDNKAWIAYHNHADFTYNGNQKTIRWMESVFLVREKDQWRIQMMHSTKLN